MSDANETFGSVSEPAGGPERPAEAKRRGEEPAKDSSRQESENGSRPATTDEESERGGALLLEEEPEAPMVTDRFYHQFSECDIGEQRRLLETLSREEIQAIRFRVLSERDKIEKQLQGHDTKVSKGEKEEDLDWRHRAEEALRYKSRLAEYAQSLLLRKRLKEQMSFLRSNLTRIEGAVGDMSERLERASGLSGGGAGENGLARSGAGPGQNASETGSEPGLAEAFLRVCRDVLSEERFRELREHAQAQLESEEDEETA